MNIENKKTALDDEAALYKHETDKLTEKEKLSGMTREQKWQHFKQYYLLKVIFGVVVLAILTSIIISVVKPKKKEVFYACVFDGCVGRDLIYDISDNFEKSLALDSTKYKLTFDQDFLYNGPYCEATQRFAMLARAGTATVAIMPKSIYEMFARANYFESVEDFLSEEDLLIFREKLVFVSKLDEKGQEIEGSLMPYGLIIDGCGALESNTCREPVVLAFVTGKSQDNYAQEFMKFLFANE